MNFGADLYNKCDFEAIKILGDFLPDKIFDAHAHTFAVELLKKSKHAQLWLYCVKIKVLNGPIDAVHDLFS